MIKTVFCDLGSIDYKEAWDYQENLFNEVLTSKLANADLPADQKKLSNNYLLFCEHPHVYTLGKSGKEQNMLLDLLQLQAKEATFHKINRGGDITYHGPGQIVGYPILNLETYDMGIKKYIETLEQAVINCIADYGIVGTRLEGATGVWLDVGKPTVRKICAIGVRISRWVSMHGFAFNVNTDLKYFEYINPCGFVDKGVTSLKKELGKELDIEEVKHNLKSHITKLFDMTLEID
ncbi:lipoyl(octanoyl) transferase LipB [Labilibaculum sp. A4]|uniref:lipoyl(octanoyl) transferase LipB n=1 Tax=Labilibaculum euxinus TaxID=2686357 RepID=UPI000F61CBF3|nr:lipoyl(octanoyl) transferase LipB [Labilibaculum euxinus]MDQ1769890.1 lipoyl(octanoyl) transferase LipB [Labilibaculum euxinus]MWN76446.1 lipoyl(octanoyl) transferase LipB [Labilibaculum euxinus]